MRRILIITFTVTIFLFFSSPAIAGPPFVTDDPETVEYQHWEFYLASASQYANTEIDATLPHVEINYGLVQNVQIHVLSAMSYSKTGSSKLYGYNNTEVGVKYRAINDEESEFQVGIFPLVELPMGGISSQNTDGKAQVFLPVWIQKDYGKFTTYGGAGFWYNPGEENKNWVYAGWECQYEFTPLITIGSELYYHTADVKEGLPDSGFNIGGFVNINEHNHILFSAGHSFNFQNVFFGYCGYQYTI